MPPASVSSSSVRHQCNCLCLCRKFDKNPIHSSLGFRDESSCNFASRIFEQRISAAFHCYSPMITRSSLDSEPQGRTCETSPSSIMQTIQEI